MILVLTGEIMILIKIGICCCFFIIGGLATTNILRLLKGCTVNILENRCFCPSCGVKISALNQTPILSFLWNKGKCRNCNSRIPLDGLIVEIVVFLGMTIIALIGDFSPLSILLSFIYYEFVRIVLILIYGRRESNFFKQYVISVFAMTVYFLLIEFLSLLLF